MVGTSESGRRRKLVVLALLLAAAFALMAAQLRAPQRVSAVGGWTVSVFAPLFRGGSWTAVRLREAAGWAIRREAALIENRALRRDNANLSLEMSLLREQVAKMERERSVARSPLNEMRLDSLYANVVAFSPEPWARTLTIDLGRIHGVFDHMPAVDYTGAVVGMVVNAREKDSTVRLLCEAGYAIGAQIVSSREIGMVTGMGESNRLRFQPSIDPSEPQRQLSVGMELISSGFADSPYPRGLRIGTIKEFHTDEQGATYADVDPAANFDSLEEVILIAAERKSSPASATASSFPAGSEPAAAESQATEDAPPSSGPGATQEGPGEQP